MTPKTLMSPNRPRGFLALEPFRLFQHNPMRFFQDPFSFQPFHPTEEKKPFTAKTQYCEIYETKKEDVVKLELQEIKK